MMSTSGWIESNICDRSRRTSAGSGARKHVLSMLDEIGWAYWNGMEGVEKEA